MPSELVAEYRIEQLSVSSGIATLCVQALMRAGFQFQPQPGVAGAYWVDGNRFEELDVSAALRAFDQAKVSWAIELWKVALGEELSEEGEWPDDYLLHFSQPQLGGERAELFARMGFSTHMPHLDSQPLLSQEFLAWSIFLANLTIPFYGWGGDNYGLFGKEAVPVADVEVANLQPQPIEWLNIFGPAYVRQIGLERLITAPAWRVEPLVYGGIAVALGPHPYSVSIEDAAAVAKHLGAPDQA